MCFKNIVAHGDDNTSTNSWGTLLFGKNSTSQITICVWDEYLINMDVIVGWKGLRWRPLMWCHTSIGFLESEFLLIEDTYHNAGSNNN